MGGDVDWREQRRAAHAAHVAALERQRAAESARARELLAGFIQEMTARGVPPGRLRAPVDGGRGSYRTGVTGWYLRRNRTIGVSIDGDYYLLAARRSLRARLFGARMVPTDPPLRVGVGARDGESMPLAWLLRERLDAAETSPAGGEGAEAGGRS